MIHKEVIAPESERLSPKQLSGHEAERQMAFYLRRTFGESTDAHVLNDLRLERNGEVAQIDHLVIHKHGMIIIESKSVSGEVHINDHLEYVYVYGRKRVGMPSPTLQAKRQGELLKALLIDHKDQLRNKYFFGMSQGGFQHCPIQVLVAISDKSIIRRPNRSIPELMKADQVTEEVGKIVSRHAKGAKLLSAVDGHWGQYIFHQEEIDRVIQFLKGVHAPKQVKSTAVLSDEKVHGSVSQRRSNDPKPRQTHQAVQHRRSSPERRVSKQASKNLPVYLCMHCQSTKLVIRYGRSYYFKCLDCDGNTWIKHECSLCQRSMRTQKRGDEFSKVCKACNQECVFFVNPSSVRD